MKSSKSKKRSIAAVRNKNYVYKKQSLNKWQV